MWIFPSLKITNHPVVDECFKKSMTCGKLIKTIGKSF